MASTVLLPDKVGVVVVARDAEEVIERCVTSALACAVDEVLVVDTGSRDDTPARVSDLGDPRLVLERIPWRGSFAEARNSALDLASTDVVFFLDADEWVATDDVHRFTSAVRQSALGEDVDVLSPVIQEWGTDATFHGVGRVLRRDGPRYISRVHEYAAFATRPARYAEVDLLIWHDGYSSPRASGARRAERNRRLMDLDLAEQPWDARMLFFSLRERLPLAPAPEISARLALMDGARVAPTDLYSARHYQYAASVDAITRLVVLGEWDRATDATDALAGRGAAAAVDARYFRSLIAVLTESDVRTALRETALMRRRGVGIDESMIASDGRHLDAVIAALLELTGQHERGRSYREECERWTDAFFERSRLRTATDSVDLNGPASATGTG